MQSLAELIRQAETGRTDEEGYNALNRGSVHSATAVDFSELTVAQVMAAQALPVTDPNRYFAVGGYQAIPDTLKEAVQGLKIPTNTPFTPALQDHIFAWYLTRDKRPQIRRYIDGSSDDIAAAQLALAREWASVADPRTGKSVYDGKGGNSASVPPAKARAVLEQAREKFHTARSAGNDYEVSWEIALFGEPKAEPWLMPDQPSKPRTPPVPVAAEPIEEPPTMDISQDPDFLAWKQEREQARLAEAYRKANTKPLLSSLVTKFVLAGIGSWLTVKYGIDIPPEFQDAAENVIVAFMGAGAVYGRQRATTFINGILGAK